MADTQYQPKPFIFASRGIIARYAEDRLPPGSYINLQGCYERAEDAMSSRYGNRIVNRDPDNVGDGVNYYFANPVNTISRLKYNAATWRYAGVGNDLYRRTGDTQGAYSLIKTGLSSLPFGSASTNCFASSQPYLFIADADLMLKDSGTGTPTKWGITPPNQPANVTEYGPNLLLVDDFTGSPGGYTTVNVSGWAGTSIGSVTAGTAAPVNDFVQFGTVTGLTAAFNGALATNTESVEGVIFNIYSTPNPPQFSAIGVTGTLAATPDTFTLVGIGGSVAANTVGSVGKTVALDLSQNNQVTDDDLICIAMQLSNPAGISEIKVMFDVNNSGYTSSYYYKSISPAYYQSGVTGDTDAYQTASNQILALSLGLLTGSNPAQPPNGIVAQLQSSTANTGADAWSTIYSRRGDFVPVGNAGENGFDWASVTGWQIEVTTTTEASVDFAVNGLYLQWGSGPSSFGGVGYDYRYIYFNANTQTPSNPSSQQFFSQQFGYVASYAAPIVLRQAFNVTGVFSSDPQVTHIRIYRRGGYLNENWYYVDQIPNVTAGGMFAYKDIIPDASLLQSDTLQLDNDPPITSSLQNPLVTNLTGADVGPGTSPYDNFVPQVVNVADSSAVFLPSQLVVIGTPQNLEQVRVIAGGVGVFTAVLRLTHAAGEQVQVFSIPEQPCDLVTLAYGQLWVAGDPNNPHFLYYSKPGYPENFSPANYIPVGSPSSPIMAVINFRGTLLVATLTTWYQISPGNPPYAQPTGSTHGLVSKTGWTHAESAIWYCLPEDESEILTRTGWKCREELILGEDVLAYDMEAKTSKWTPVEAINVFDYDGELIRINGGRVGTRFDFSCTPDHKWVWNPERRSKPYDSNWKAHPEKHRWSYGVCACGGPKSKKAKRCKACKDGREDKLRPASELSMAGNIVQAARLHTIGSLLTPREAAVLGWIVTDGSIAKNNGRKDGRRSARIHQVEASVDCHDIRALLGDDLMSVYRRDKVGYTGKPLVYLDFAMSTEFTEYLLQKAGFVSRDDLHKIVCSLDFEAAKAMLDAMIAGDGSRGKATTFAQNKGPVMEAFRILAFMCGNPTNAPKYGRYSGYKKDHGRTCLANNPNIDCQMIRKTRRHYKGKVWCPTTKYGTWVARSNDTISITGNCAIDGIREFRGSDGPYRSLPIEWVFQDVPLTPLPLLDRTAIGDVCMGFLNNTVFTGYKALDGNQYRLVWSTDYSRWRNDDVPATAMYLEEDTNTLLFAKAVTGGYAICQDRFGDYDDGGWINGQLTKSPINMNLQAPYEDLGAPHFPKTWNTVEVDANTAGQEMTVILNFDEGIAPLTIGTINTTTRQKIQLEVNVGLGQESYKCSPQIVAAVVAAPFLYQMNVYAGVLAAARTSLDTYWIDFGSEASKFVKQCYFDYTSTAPINIAIYADGSDVPYYTVSLPAAPNRSDIRVRFPALKMRKFRMVVLSDESMQMWRSPRIEHKLVSYGSSYALYEVGT